MLWSIKINSELDYCYLIWYQLVCNLLTAANGNLRHTGHHCCRQTSQIREHTEVVITKLITTVIYWFLQNPLIGASEQTWARPPTTRTVWIHRIHAAGGASGSITMVVVFVGCLWCCGWTRDVTSSLYVKRYERITQGRVMGVIKWLTQACTIPGMHAIFVSLTNKIWWFFYITNN